MQIDNILVPEAVVSGLKLSSKKRVLKCIAEIAERLYGLESEMLLHALIEREDLGSTAMGCGIAIPHARIEGLDAVHGIFIKLDMAIDFDASDREAVDMFFAILAPKDSGSDHLKALARISRILRNADLREKIRSTQDSDAIFAILCQDSNVVAA